MTGDLDSKTLGTLTLKLSSNVKGSQAATMIVGHSLMEGRTDNLKKPLVAIRPAAAKDDGAARDQAAGGDSPPSSKEGGSSSSSPPSSSWHTLPCTLPHTAVAY